jgi:hypothetical protein
MARRSVGYQDEPLLPKNRPRGTNMGTASVVVVVQVAWSGLWPRGIVNWVRAATLCRELGTMPQQGQPALRVGWRGSEGDNGEHLLSRPVMVLHAREAGG